MHVTLQRHRVWEQTFQKVQISDYEVVNLFVSAVHSGLPRRVCLTIHINSDYEYHYNKYYTI